MIERADNMTKKVRLGNQTPTQSVILPYKKSFGNEAIKYYEASKRKAQKWQSDLLKHILSTNKEKLWVHTKFGYSVPRRNGKNEIVAIRENYGLEKGEQILHTAHRTTTSHSAFERLIKILNSRGMIEKEDYKATRQFGLETIEHLKTGGKISFRTRSSKGGLGEGFDLLVIDEAQEYTDDQESALKYVVTDSKNPQTIFCGTPPTLVSSGTVFTKFRKGCLAGELENAGWAEWSIEDMSNIRDKELWYQTNPSLGTIFTERSISDEVGEDEIDFNIQRLGLWLKYNQKSEITAVDWERLQVDKLPKLKGKLYVGIKFSQKSTVAMSIAVKTQSGEVFVEAIDCRSAKIGTEWIISFLKSADVQGLVIDGASGQQILAKDIKDYRIRTKPILPTVKEVITANAKWELGIYEQTIKHKGQPSLAHVVTNCEKRNIGSNGGFGYNAQFKDDDIALMDSAILAHWICTENKSQNKQTIRY